MLINLNELVILRKELHKYPELSNYESETANRILNFLRKYPADETITGIGGHGIAVIYRGEKQGETVLFRCELDALPIEEENEFEYKSVYKNISHKCGHDGHMAIMAGLASHFSKNRPAKGSVILLFQPAEETGEGADRVVNDPRFKPLKPDYVFALHNLPGFDKNSIIYKKGHFAAASNGMVIKLRGKTSHAGEPEKGINPAKAVSIILREIIELPEQKDIFKDFTLATIVHVKLGEIAFGTSAGYAEIRTTLRSYRNDDMEQLTKSANEIISNTALKENLRYEISYTEKFPSTINDNDSTDFIVRSAKSSNFAKIKLKKPFRWSEDFSHFTNNYKGALFGVGSGIDHSKVHNPDYDFPDEIIETGIRMFQTIFYQINKSMLVINVLKSENDFNEKLNKEQLIDFLFKHLDRFGDPKEAIAKSIDYALSDKESMGGFLLAAYLDEELVGGLVMNKTGMGGYIPENILVYVAVDANKRGNGIGKKIVEKSFAVAEGDVKLHVEYDNPAKRLYERIGFTNKYAEMRYNNK